MSASPLAVVPLTPWAARLGYAGALPFIALAAAAWWALAAMALTAVALGLYFWRKRYLARTRR